MSAETVFIRNSGLRSEARALLKGNWTIPVIVTLVFIAINGVANALPIVQFAAMIVVSPALIMGYCAYFLKFARKESCEVATLFDGFKSHFARSMAVYWLMALFVFLWSLLFIIPGIVAALGYSMSYYIMLDDPKIRAIDAMKKSKEMMKGHKGRLFGLYLSFIGWFLLGVISLGIGFLWILPYMMTAEIRFYENLRSLPRLKTG